MTTKKKTKEENDQAIQKKQSSIPNKVELWKRTRKYFLVFLSTVPLLPLTLLYISYQPDIDLITKEIVNLNEPFSSPIMIQNQNPYSIKDVVIDITYHASEIHTPPFHLKNITVHDVKEIKRLQSKQIQRIKFSKVSLTKLYSLKSAKITFIISFKTPFYYPDKDSIKFTYDVEKYESDKTKWVIDRYKY